MIIMNLNGGGLTLDLDLSIVVWQRFGWLAFAYQLKIVNPGIALHTTCHRVYVASRQYPLKSLLLSIWVCARLVKGCLSTKRPYQFGVAQGTKAFTSLPKNKFHLAINNDRGTIVLTAPQSLRRWSKRERKLKLLMALMNTVISLISGPRCERFHNTVRAMRKRS